MSRSDSSRPYADPVLLPTVALINGLGVAFLRRLDLGAAPAELRDGADALHRAWPSGRSSGRPRRRSARSCCWFSSATIGSLSRYAYTLGLVGIVLVMIPALLPAQYSVVNGAKLWILIGGFSIQPGEFAKLALLSFFAYYLVRKREVLSLASKRFLGIDFPRGRDLGPGARGVAAEPHGPGVREGPGHLADVLRHVRGDALHRHRTVQLAHHRSAAVLRRGLPGLVAGRDRSVVRSSSFASRVDVWLHPFDDADDTGYQMVQSLLGLGTGGLFGAGPGNGLPYLADLEPLRRARGAQRLHLRRHRRGDRAVRAERRCSSRTC